MRKVLSGKFATADRFVLSKVARNPMSFRAKSRNPVAQTLPSENSARFLDPFDSLSAGLSLDMTIDS